MTRNLFTLLTLSGSMGFIAAQAPAIDPNSVGNAASYISTLYPNGGVTRGGTFILKGKTFGACGTKVADKFSLTTTMNGTSIKVKMGGSSFDAPMVYVVACINTQDQVAAIMPSNVPAGSGTVTLSYNGQTSPSVPIVVVERGFGFFTINQGGTGPAVIQNYNSATNLVINSLGTPATPGQYAVAWGTGLGSDGNSDVDAPKPTDIPINLEFYVGGQPATVTYKGRSGCCSGIDQIVFQVPNGVEGCFVPVVAKIGNMVSNFTTMSISSSSGPCNDPNGITAADVTAAQKANRIRLGMIDLFRFDNYLVLAANTANIQRQDFGSASIVDMSYGAFLGLPVREVSTPGSCVVWRGIRDELALNQPPILAAHDHNIDPTMDTIRVTGAAGTESISRNDTDYESSLGGWVAFDPPLIAPLGNAFLNPGTFTVTGSGSVIGSFSGTLAAPAPPKFTNLYSIPSRIDRSQGVTVTWSGVDASGMVEIRGLSDVLDNTNLYNASFYCVERASAGQFTVPQVVLQSLPVTGPDNTGNTVVLSLGVSSVATGRFSGNGVDTGLLRFNGVIGRSLNYK